MSYDEQLIQLRALLDGFQDPVDGTVYHYTTAEGFRGIVASGELWFTNTAFVNDTEECGALWSLKTEDVLGPPPFPNKYVEKRWHEWVERRREEWKNIYYIASFSRNENQLQQYRAYGSFCIGFQASDLARAGFRWYNCVYDQKEMQNWIRSKSQVEQWQGDSLNDKDRDAAAMNLLLAAERKYKSRDYYDEQEVRIICESHHTWKQWPNRPTFFSEDPPIYFRDHPVYKMPVPYVKFLNVHGKARGNSPWSECSLKEKAREMKQRKLKEEGNAERALLPIMKVMIGPMAQQEEVTLASEIMLGEKGYENVPVIASQIPYRGV